MTCGCGVYKTDRRLSDEADYRDADDTEDGHDEDEYVALGDDGGDDSDAGNDEGHLLWPMQAMNLLHIAPHRRVHHSRDETPKNATLQSARGRRLEVLGPSSQVRRQATKSPEILFKRLHDLQVQQKNTQNKKKKTRAQSGKPSGVHANDLPGSPVRLLLQGPAAQSFPRP